MIKREELKKGDRVLIIPNSNYTRIKSYYEGQVTGIGPKFITVAYIYYGGELGQTIKFNNDDKMAEKDYSNTQLFLGTEEEYLEYKQQVNEAKEIWRDIDHNISYTLGLEKLKAIKAIIESDDLYETICQLYVEQTAK